MQSFFNKQFGFKLFMSATLGDLNQFAKNSACTKVRTYKMPSTFQYNKSPIWVKTNNHLNYKNIGTKYAVLAAECEWILKKHSSEQGIIHTSSFAIGNEVYNLLSKESQERILLYTSTQEKEDYIRILKYDIKNRILMGPSILEGIDLPDNQSRFQIILKMPYPSLSNTFVKLKSEYDKSWYNMKTTLNILQGIGRSIRNPTDWAETYILDTNVIYLLKNRTFFSNEFLDRVKNYL
jgi:Rad3-related DNA helicase